MTQPTLDQKYSDLVDQLGIQNATFKAFLQGMPDDTVRLDDGRTIKTLTGVIRDLNRFQYVQRVIDHRLYSDMVADSTIDVGLLIRVWGDTININGLYQKTDVSTFNKISYQDIYDLRNFLPSPWNYLQVTATSAQIQSGYGLLDFEIPVSATIISDQVINGTYKYTVNSAGNRGTVSGDIKIIVSAGDKNVVYVIFNNKRVVNAVDASLSSLTNPEKFILFRSSDDSVHKFLLVFIPGQDASNQTLIGDLDFRLQGIDLSVVDKPVDPTVTVIPAGVNAINSTYVDTKM